MLYYNFHLRVCALNDSTLILNAAQYCREKTLLFGMRQKVRFLKVDVCISRIFFKVTIQNEVFYNLPYLSKYAIKLKLSLTSELTVSISEQNLS